MTPTKMGGSNVIQNTIDAGKAFAEAISATHVPRVVMLSSIGADHATGNGPVAGLLYIEEIYRQPEGKHLRYIPPCRSFLYQLLQ